MEELYCNSSTFLKKKKIGGSWIYKSIVWSYCPLFKIIPITTATLPQPHQAYVVTYCKSRQKTRLPNKWSQVAAKGSSVGKQIWATSHWQTSWVQFQASCKIPPRWVTNKINHKILTPKKLLQSIPKASFWKNLKNLSNFTCSGQFFPWAGQKNHPAKHPNFAQGTGGWSRKKWSIEWLNQLYCSDPPYGFFQK